MPTFQSAGRMLDDNDCENNNVRYAAHTCLTFMRSFELMSSTPAEEESLMFSITEMMPSVENVIGDIDSVLRAGEEKSGTELSHVKTKKGLVKKVRAFIVVDYIAMRI